MESKRDAFRWMNRFKWWGIHYTMDSYSEVKRDGTLRQERHGIPGTLRHGVPGLVTHTSSLNACEKSKSEGQLGLHNEFQASLGDMLRSCL